MSKKPTVDFAAYVTGTAAKADVAASITAASIAKAANAAARDADAAQKVANGKKGGALGVAFAAALALQFVTPELIGKSRQDVTGWMLEKGLTLSADEKAAKVMRSQLHALMKAAKAWKPTASDSNGVVFSEALAFVREGIAKHKTLTAWIKEGQTQRKPGGKTNPTATTQKASEGAASPAITETAPAPATLTPTAPVLAMTASKALDALATLAGAGDEEALNFLRKLAIDASAAYDTAEAAHAKAENRKARRAA